MSGLNVGEILQPLRINLNEDISTATSVLMLLQPEYGTTKELTATAPDTPVTINGVTLNANEYVEYITALESDLDYAGRWRMRAKVTFPDGSVKKTDYVKFRVNE